MGNRQLGNSMTKAIAAAVIASMECVPAVISGHYLSSLTQVAPEHLLPNTGASLSAIPALP